MVDQMQVWKKGTRLITARHDAKRGKVSMSEFAELVCLSLVSANIADEAIESMLGGGK